MSWSSAVAGRALSLRASPYESRRFGLTFSRAEVPLAVADQEAALDTVLQYLRDGSSDVVVVRYPATQVGWFARLRESGLDLVAADTLVYWRLSVGEGRTPEPRTNITARVTETPEPDLVEELVADMFAGYGNHYLANPLLDPAAALAGYVEWAHRSAVDDTAVIVDRTDAGPIGLATIETVDGVSEIQLAGIRQSAQRQGVYPYVLAACEGVARAAGAQSLVISTQVHNSNVQRAWSRYGFEPVGAVSTVHAVRSGLL